jgi:hypothetical protein
MSTSKRAPLNHSPEQVKEVALMLYARRPPSALGSIKSEWEWDSLIWQALDVLDNLDKACARVDESRRKTGARGRRAEKELSFGADGRASYDEAVMFITRQAKLHVARAKKLELATKRFEALPLFSPLNFGVDLQKPKVWRRQIARWQKIGMTRDEVDLLRSLYDEMAYRRWRSPEGKPWTKMRKVNALGQSREMTQMSPEEKTSVREVIESGYKLEVERAEQAKQRRRPRKKRLPA